MLIAHSTPPKRRGSTADLMAFARSTKRRKGKG